MKLVWLPQAEFAWQNIAEYIFKEFGAKALLNYGKHTDDWIDVIIHNPIAFQREQLLLNREKTYYSVIVNHLTKLVYFVDADTIYIADVWDTRQLPDISAL